MYHFIARNGPEAGRRYELREGRYVLGRHPECQIVIDVGAVSRQHCAVAVEGEGCFCEDLKSRNGTFVNGEQIHGRHKLADNDIVQICEVEFQFHDPARTLVAPGSSAGLPREKEPSLFAMMVDEQEGGSTIMSRLDASSGFRGGGAFTASPEVRLTAILEVMQNLGKALSLDDVLSKILGSLFKIFLQADRGSIVLQEPDGRLIPRWTKARREDAVDSIRISRTICRQVMESKQALLSADAASDVRFEMSQSIADFRIRSIMCCPLIDSEGNSLGVLQLDTLDQRKKFQAEDLELFTSVAAQASVAIQNAQLNEQVQRQREAEQELKLAREVQLGFLPDSRPVYPGLEFFDFYQPANQIGGDYFDYIPLPDGKLAIVVADVVGHGVAAALLMAKIAAETHNALLSHASPAKAITSLNTRLCQNASSRFVTMVLVVLDPRTARCQVVCAGHMPPLVRRATGLIDEPGNTSAGMPLGIVDGMDYEQEEFKIGAGETVMLYTDGINECADATGAMYTIDRLRHVAAESALPPAELGKLILSDVRRFHGTTLPADDMCLVAFGRPPKPQSKK